jgi:hypothetical protein
VKQRFAVDGDAFSEQQKIADAFQAEGLIYARWTAATFVAKGVELQKTLYS